MSELKIPIVHIKYKSEYGVLPESVQILSTDPLTLDQLPTLTENGYKFINWVHINPDGHESALSERMIISTDWLIPTDVVNEFYVIFTAKWINDRKNLTGDVYEGSYTVFPKAISQLLPTAEKFMEQDVIIESIPYVESDNPAGGKTVTIG